MMRFFLIMAISLILTFLLNPIFKKTGATVKAKRSLDVHVHHSVFGLILLAIGIIIDSNAVIAVGLGIYLAHGLEEMYFNKRRFPKAFFIFVTR